MWTCGTRIHRVGVAVLLSGRPLISGGLSSRTVLANRYCERRAGDNDTCRLLFGLQMTDCLLDLSQEMKICSRSTSIVVQITHVGLHCGIPVVHARHPWRELSSPRGIFSDQSIFIHYPCSCFACHHRKKINVVHLFGVRIIPLMIFSAGYGWYPRNEIKSLHGNSSFGWGVPST